MEKNTGDTTVPVEPSEIITAETIAVRGMVAQVWKDHAPRLGRTDTMHCDVRVSFPERKAADIKYSDHSKDDAEALPYSVIHPGTGKDRESNAKRPILLIHPGIIGDPLQTARIALEALPALLNPPERQTTKDGTLRWTTKTERYRKDAEALFIGKDGRLDTKSPSWLSAEASAKRYLDTNNGIEAWKAATDAAFSLAFLRTLDVTDADMKERALQCKDDETFGRGPKAKPATDSKPAVERRHIYMKVPERYVSMVLQHFYCPVCFDATDSKVRKGKSPAEVAPLVTILTKREREAAVSKATVPESQPQPQDTPAPVGAEA